MEADRWAPGIDMIVNNLPGTSHAVQMESLKDDAMLYPGKADEKLLKKMPPTIVWSAEFDYYITEATRFASRLREAGRLLEFVVIPGAKHESRVSPIFSVFKLETEAWRLAIQEYLIK